MRIAIISDTHFGYSRFEEDAFRQAESAFLDAAEKADLIICAGDIFDSKIPKLETINRAAEILKKVSKPIYAIHGNHERRSKGMINAPQLLATMGLLKYIHNEVACFEKDSERVCLYGLGNMPDEYIKTAIEMLIERHNPRNDAINMLIIHQSIRDLVPTEGCLTLEELDELPFDVIINGHIHGATIKMNGKLLIPGSTVVTQLKKEETTPKCYILYDTKTKTAETIDIKARPFFYEELEFNGEKISEIKAAVEAKISELKKKAEKPIIKIKIKGRSEACVGINDFVFAENEDIYIENELVGAGLKEKLERIKNLKSDGLTIKNRGEKLLIEKTTGKIKMFDPIEMLDYLLLTPDDAFNYLMERIKIQSVQ
jgi:putative phosphoesterase